jgi:phosphomannomutase
VGIFKANDIRGKYPVELDRETIYSIGLHLPTILKTTSILIGRDVRNSSNEIFEILSDGITDSGAEVVDIGLCDTPAVYFATAYYGFDGSVMITASHNPPEYNGLKISRSLAVPVGPDTGLKELERLLSTKKVQEAEKGEITNLDISRDYKNHISKFMSDYSGLKAVFDCGNGAAAAYVHKIFSDTSLRYTTLFDDPDGTFPNHGPNPLEKESWISIKAEILKQKADVGIIFDGDADRAIFFDEKGSFISPDIITALIGHYYYDKKLEGSKNDNNGQMYYDIRSSRSVLEYVESLGGKSSPCTTGHANIKKILRESNGTYAGELSGHYYFRENYFCDSAFIAAAVVLGIINKSKIPVSEITRGINPYFFSGEINFEVKDQELILNKITEYFPKGNVNNLDGVKIDFNSWWFILRPSGAEPLLRLVVEAESEKLMKEKIMELKTIIKSFK